MSEADSIFSKTSLQIAITLLAGSTLALLSCANLARADVKLHPLFSDNMVLQREKTVPVWGTARAGERVQIQIGAQSKNVVADANGAWRVTFDAMSATGSTPFVATGDNKIELKNVAVGEVWICSGQSNMAWQLYRARNGDAEVAAATDADLRFFSVPLKMATKPQTDFAAPTQWEVSTPQSAKNFSAVAYFFGRELRQKLKVPIGLINASYGGSSAETWVRRETLSDLGESYQQQIANFDVIAAHREKVSLAEDFANWWQTNDIGTRENWQAPETSIADWKTIELPSAIETVEKGFDGVMWFRREIEIPESWAGKDLVLRLGVIEDYDNTYFNGLEIGAIYNPRVLRNYNIPGAQVKAGRATIATRVYDLTGAGGFVGNPSNVGHDLAIYQKADPKQLLELNGAWQYRLSAPRIGTPVFPSDWRAHASYPATLTNAMIAPLVPFSTRGVIWYQGESNVGYYAKYRTLFPALIRDWRAQWNAKEDGSDFPFYFVQLANYMSRVPEPVQTGMADLRESQTMTLSTPGTGMALAIDVGEANDIHPTNKQTVGHRLALVALAKTYGQSLEYSGPMFEKMELIAGTNRALISFTYATGLTLSDVKRAPTIEEQEFAKVPLDHWVYNAVGFLKKNGVLELETFDPKQPKTRFEFAVITARLMQNPEVIKLVAGNNSQNKDAMDALKREFQPELAALGVRENGLDVRVTQFDPSKIPPGTKLKIKPPVLNEGDVAMQPALAPTTEDLVKGFAISGADGKWFDAQALISGNSVLVWNDEVFAPVAVRYAWKNNPDVNLVNAAGLPAVPFRTDGP